MAKFDTPFSSSADRRYPTSDERQNGFPCGPADQRLFNGLFYRLESEIGEVIDHAGIIQTDDRFTQLREAIVALIEAATGGGDPENYLLVSQARARLPVFPEVQNVDGKIVVTAPATGTVRVPGGVTFLHRGIFPVTTVQEDFATVSSKTYHLRWNPTDGFSLNDVSDTDYNPSLYVEANPLLDSTYDDMLVARIITNSSNIATITNLVNKSRILTEIANEGNMTTSSAANLASRVAQLSWNLARTPVMSVYPTSIGTSGTAAGGQFAANQVHDHDFQITRNSLNRYGASLTLGRDYATSFDILATVTA
ncbi:hypothetical protein VQ042_22390 [Aurantimonas sp. A2-1-M11]|uniref:hypothetical protein n=1 Tax=Aurantimonas sp. A2-1-M11 TaxID=3113712 RepID=UPI002F952C67